VVRVINREDFWTSDDNGRNIGDVPNLSKSDAEELGLRLCNWCNGVVEEKFLKTEGWSICTQCGAIEGGDHYASKG
jgi:hypothetical protein